MLSSCVKWVALNSDFFFPWRVIIDYRGNFCIWAINTVENLKAFGRGGGGGGKLSAEGLSVSGYYDIITDVDKIADEDLHVHKQPRYNKKQTNNTSIYIYILAFKENVMRSL